MDRTRPAPLILALHGAGGIASQILQFLVPLVERYGTVVLAPESRGRTWDVMTGAYGPDVYFIGEALGWLFERQAIEPRHVAIGGFSDGASYALSLGLGNGELFTDILAFSPGFMAPARQVGTPRIFVSHGVNDEVLPIDPCSRTLVPKLHRAGYDTAYHEFDGGHVMPDDMVMVALDRFLARTRVLLCLPSS